MKNNREAERARKRLMVRYGQDALTKAAFTQNLSRTGLMVKTNHVFPPGTMLQVLLRFPEKTFTLWARVAWAKKVPPQLAHVLDCGMGMEFVDPPSEWRDFFAGWAGNPERD